MTQFIARGLAAAPLVFVAFLGAAVAVGMTLNHLIAQAGPTQGFGDIAGRQAALDAPQLWRAEVLDDKGAVRGAVNLCADQAVRSGFTHPLPQVNGEMCLQMGRAVSKPGLYATRCVAAGQRYSVNVGWRGDPTRDLTVTFATRPIQVDDPGVVQVTRYRRLGACPAGWAIGQSAKG